MPRSMPMIFAHVLPRRRLRPRVGPLLPRRRCADANPDPVSSIKIESNDMSIFLPDDQCIPDRSSGRMPQNGLKITYNRPASQPLPLAHSRRRMRSRLVSWSRLSDAAWLRRAALLRRPSGQHRTRQDAPATSGVCRWRGGARAERARRKTRRAASPSPRRPPPHRGRVVREDLVSGRICCRSRRQTSAVELVSPTHSSV